MRAIFEIQNNNIILDFYSMPIGLWFAKSKFCIYEWYAQNLSFLFSKENLHPPISITNHFKSDMEIFEIHIQLDSIESEPMRLNGSWEKSCTQILEQNGCVLKGFNRFRILEIKLNKNLNFQEFRKYYEDFDSLLLDFFLARQRINLANESF